MCNPLLCTSFIPFASPLSLYALTTSAISCGATVKPAVLAHTLVPSVLNIAALSRSPLPTRLEHIRDGTRDVVWERTSSRRILRPLLERAVVTSWLECELTLPGHSAGGKRKLCMKMEVTAKGKGSKVPD